jgi:hypothetical protein
MRNSIRNDSFTVENNEKLRLMSFEFNQLNDVFGQLRLNVPPQSKAFTGPHSSAQINRRRGFKFDFFT